MRSFLRRFLGARPASPRRVSTKTRTIGISSSRTTMYLRHKEDARNLVKARLAHYNTHYGFCFGRVAIRDQRSRWGSCSSKGNLNFNYRILFLPEHLLDLVIVHELCHLREMNHSADFWALVAQTIPDHKERRRVLSKIPARSLTPSSFLP